jgi:hypothetical protein
MSFIFCFFHLTIFSEEIAVATAIAIAPVTDCDNLPEILIVALEDKVASDLKPCAAY